MSGSAHPARRLWAVAETIHAVTYFHPAALAAIAGTGAKGFWMGYFAGRLSPMGPVGPSVATAVCCNFSPTRTERALPDAWGHVPPTVAVVARAHGAAAALRDCGVDAPDATVLAQLERLVSGLDPCGRPLGAANLDVDLPREPVERLWQLCTTLREHRGDGHVALLVGAGLDGCEANVLATAVHSLDPVILRDTRAWTTEEWGASVERLAVRGLVHGDGSATDAGRELHAGIERRTDELAALSYERSDPDVDLEALRDALRPAARRVADAGVLPFPNPMGLPAE